MKIAVVVGNPKPKSRTLTAGTKVADGLGATETVVIDVVELGAGLLGWGDATVKEAQESVMSSDVIVAACPTYKASYTGLLKIFLDLFPSNGLAGVVGVPVMLGAGPAHYLAPELLLKPVLVELGATCPTKGLYVMDSQYEDDSAYKEWLDVATPQVAASIAGLA
jgi:FMN reductase